VEPGIEYTYIVTCYDRFTKNPEIGLSQEITISTEEHIKGDQGIYFNRGVSGSQSYTEDLDLINHSIKMKM